DHEVITGVLGPLHTLKGNSGMMGFAGVKDYVHRLEDVFAQVSEGGLALSPALFDRLFAGASALRDAVERACKEKTEVRDLGPERAELERLLAGGAHDAGPGAAAPHAPAAAAIPEAVKQERAEARRSAENQYVTARSNMVRVDFAQLDHL